MQLSCPCFSQVGLPNNHKIGNQDYLYQVRVHSKMQTVFFSDNYHQMYSCTTGNLDVVSLQIYIIEDVCLTGHGA